MSMMPTRRRVTSFLRNDRRRTVNLSSLRRRTEAESFVSELRGEWRTLGSLFSSGSPQPTAPVSERAATQPVISTVADVLNRIDSTSLNRRDGD